MPGASGNYFSSDASPAIVNLDVRFQIALDDYTPAAVMTIASQYNATGNQKSWVVDIGTLGDLHLGVSLDGSTYASPEIGTNILAGYTAASTNWFRIARIDSTGGITAYVSTDYDPSNISSGTWTSIGTGTSSSGALFDSTHTVDIGTYQSGAGQMCLGKNFRTQIVSSGALAVDFNPSTFAETSTNGATAVASTGETWTLNSTGAKPAQIVKSASLLFDGTDDFMVATFTLPKPVTIYDVVKQNVWTINHRISDGVTLNSLSFLQNDTTPKLNVFDGGFGTATDGLAVAAKGIVCHSANGAASLIQINAGTPATFTLGTTAMAGITVGTQGDLNTSVCGAFQLWERIVFTAAHTAAQRAVVQNYLAVRHQIAL